MSFCTSFLVFSLSLIVMSPLNLQQHNVLGSPQTLQDASAVKIELQPVDAEKDKIPRFKKNIRFKVMLTNNSNGLMRAVILDTYYQNRPKLHKNGELIPYRTEIAKLLTSKDKDPIFVRLGSSITLYPTKTTTVEELNLIDWYGQLEPGIYRIDDRYRLEIYGNWSSKSEAVEFEVVADRE